MRKLILTMQVSLDGFVAGPNGEVDWISPGIDDAATGWLADTLWQAGVHLMGAQTYRDMAVRWPHTTGPLSAPLNAIPKFVFSSALAQADWSDTHIVRGELAAEIMRLKALPGRDLLAHGGARFARSLVRLALVDEFRLMVHPVMLGRGLALFGELEQPRHVKLMGSRTFASGACAQILQPVARHCQGHGVPWIAACAMSVPRTVRAPRG